MAEEVSEKRLTNKQKVFISEYLKSFNATEAAIKSGYSERSAASIGSENLRKPEIITEISKYIMTPEEIKLALTDQAHADIGDFFKVVDEWTDYEPLPTYEVLGAEEREIEDGGETKRKTFYFVRHITIDLDKLKDPHYSRNVKKFSDSPKNGLSIELYGKQDAYNILARLCGLIVDKTELTGKDGAPLQQTVTVIEVIKDHGE